MTLRVMQLLGRASGGIGAHVDTLSTSLRELGATVQIVTDSLTASTFGWADAHPWWPPRAAGRLASAAVDWHRIMRAAGSVDVVHAHGTQAALVALPVVLRARPRPAFVVSLHNDLPPSTPAVMRRAIGLALRRADLVTGASADLTDLASRLGARAPRTVEVASPRVTHLLARRRLGPLERRSARESLYRSVELEADPALPLVLTVSRIAPQKDLQTLVAAARVSAVPATWVVVGGGDPALQGQLADLANGTPVTFLGHRDDLLPWWAAADVFALSSRWEARALVVQEAMAAAVPVVATWVGGIEDLVRGPEGGTVATLVPPGDPAALAEAVGHALADPVQADAVGARARTLAASWADPRTEARQWMERYAVLARA